MGHGPCLNIRPHLLPSLGEPRPRRHRRPPDPLPLIPCPVHASAGPLGQHLAFKLGVGNGDMEENLPEQARRVQPRLRIGTRAHAPVPQPLQGLGGVEDRPEAAVQPPAKHQVDLPPRAVVEQSALGDPAAKIAGAHLVGVLDYFGPALGCAELAQGQPLVLDRLAAIVSGDPQVAGHLHEITPPPDPPLESRPSRAPSPFWRAATGVLGTAPDAAGAVLGELHSLGVVLAIDDFGTGNSSLTALRRFPFQVLKIDQSFVGGIGAHHEDETIVAATIGLAHGLGLSVVAEGVETEAQREFLVQHGCDELQGYLLGRPEPELAAVAGLARRAPGVSSDRESRRSGTRSDGGEASPARRILRLRSPRLTSPPTGQITTPYQLDTPPPPHSCPTSDGLRLLDTRRP